MALEDIIKSVDLEAKRMAEEIIQRAYSESEKMLHDAKHQADSEIEAASKQAANEADSIKTMSLLSKRMELRRQYYSELNKRINDGKEHIRESVADFRGTETYKKMLQLLYDKAVSSIGESCSMRIRGSDMGLVRVSQKTKLVKDNTLDGGIVCTSSDGSAMVDYSISSIIDQLRGRIDISFFEIISKSHAQVQKNGSPKPGAQTAGRSYRKKG